MRERIRIGEVSIHYALNHQFDRLDIPMNKQGAHSTEPVIIEDDVWIGMRAIILPDVRIGKGSVIGAGTIVTKDIPEYSVFCGNPGRVVKSRKDSLTNQQGNKEPNQE